jgi:hypothetical protein
VTGAAAAPQLRLFRRQEGLPSATHTTPPFPYLQNPSARAGGERGGGSGQWGSRVPAGAEAAAPMAADADNHLEVDELLSVGDELVALLNSSKHGEDVAQAGANARMLRSVCRSELNSLELQLKGPVFLCPAHVFVSTCPVLPCINFFYGWVEMRVCSSCELGAEERNPANLTPNFGGLKVEANIKGHLLYQVT